MPATMKALACNSFGPVASLAVMDLPIPEPGPGQIRVRVQATSINPADAKTVTGLLNSTHTRLRANGYAYTKVVDRAVRVYHRNGAAIEVIWSRRRADDTEIERLAVHFEVIRTESGWRVAGIQLRPTDADALSRAWAESDNGGRP